MARSINKINIIALPLEMSGSRLNSDSFFSLKFHKVHSSTHFIRTFHLMDGLDFASIEQNPLRKCCLAGVDMSRHTDVPDFGVVTECWPVASPQRVPDHHVGKGRVEP